jgi:hypothetical protein
MNYIIDDIAREVAAEVCGHNNSLGYQVAARRGANRAIKAFLKAVTDRAEAESEWWEYSAGEIMREWGVTGD